MMGLLSPAPRSLAQAVLNLLHQFYINASINSFNIEATALALAPIFWNVTDDKIVAPFLKILIMNYDFIFSVSYYDCKTNANQDYEEQKQNTNIPIFKRRLLANESVQCIDTLDNKLIVTASYNSGIVRIWNAEVRMVVHKIFIIIQDYTFADEYPVGQVLSILSIPNGNDMHLWLATDKSIIIWSIVVSIRCHQVVNCYQGKKSTGNYPQLWSFHDNDQWTVSLGKFFAKQLYLCISCSGNERISSHYI
jgi:hypothetical protein